MCTDTKHTAKMIQNTKQFVQKRKGKRMNSTPSPLQASISFVSWAPLLFSLWWWSNQHVHYKGHVAVIQMAEWADCDLCTKSECITVSCWSQCQYQAGIFTHISTHKQHRHTDTHAHRHTRTLHVALLKNHLDAAVHRLETLITVYQAGA